LKGVGEVYAGGVVVVGWQFRKSLEGREVAAVAVVIVVVVVVTVVAIRLLLVLRAVGRWGWQRREDLRRNRPG
jgi:hypothetical protein